MKRIEHIGIAVPHLEPAVEQYKNLGFRFDGLEEVDTQKVRTAFFKIGESQIELLEPMSDDSPISKFLQKRGAGIHHICVQVSDIEAALASYKEKGVQLINERPVIGAGGHRVAFIHPKAASGVLIDLLEVKSETPDHGPNPD